MGVGLAVIAVAALAAWGALEVASPPAPEIVAAAPLPRAEAPPRTAVASAPPAGVEPAIGVGHAALGPFKGVARVPPEALEDGRLGGAPMAGAPSTDAAEGWAAMANGEEWTDPAWAVEAE